jgi:hypothetical protein
LNNRKSHNSILFLTTLGVYLGLVLVGATPQVLAQAAMTKQFNVKDEIEVKDDLDKKPDRDIELAQIDIAGALIDYADELRKLQIIGKYDPQKDLHFSKRTSFSIGRDSREMPPNQWLSLATDEFVLKLFQKNFELIVDKSTAPGVEKYLVQSAKFKVQFENSEFQLDIELFKTTPERASMLFTALNHLFISRALESTDPREKQIYEATRLSCDGRRVLIVTRLPRAGLDTLLAKDAK